MFFWHCCGRRLHFTQQWHCCWCPECPASSWHCPYLQHPAGVSPICARTYRQTNRQNHTDS
jgi:hypothetical protein